MVPKMFETLKLTVDESRMLPVRPIDVEYCEGRALAVSMLWVVGESNVVRMYANLQTFSAGSTKLKYVSFFVSRNVTIKQL